MLMIDKKEDKGGENGEKAIKRIEKEGQYYTVECPNGLIK